MPDESYLHKLLWDFGGMTNRELAQISLSRDTDVNAVMESLKRQKFVDEIRLLDGTNRKIWWAKPSKKIPWELPPYKGYSGVKPHNILSPWRVYYMGLMIRTDAILYEKFVENKMGFNYEIFFRRRYSEFDLPAGHNPCMAVKISRLERHIHWHDYVFFIETMRKIPSKKILQGLAKTITNRHSADLHSGRVRKTVLICHPTIDLSRIEKIFYKILSGSVYHGCFRFCHEEGLAKIFSQKRP